MSEENKIDYAEFPACMHAFAAALHREGISPSDITIEMPFDAWWAFSQRLQSKFTSLLWFDGRQKELDSFQYMGFKFKVKK